MKRIVDIRLGRGSDVRCREVGFAFNNHYFVGGRGIGLVGHVPNVCVQVRLESNGKEHYKNTDGSFIHGCSVSSDLCISGCDEGSVYCNGFGKGSEIHS